jgi:hypothetical protein
MVPIRNFVRPKKIQEIVKKIYHNKALTSQHKTSIADIAAEEEND